MTFQNPIFPAPGPAPIAPAADIDTGTGPGPLAPLFLPAGEAVPQPGVLPAVEKTGDTGAEADLRGREGTLETLRAAPAEAEPDGIPGDALPAAGAAMPTVAAGMVAAAEVVEAVTPQTFVVATLGELKAAFSAAGDGDRIELAAGAVFDEYVRLKGKSLDGGLTITSQDPDNPGVFSYGLELFRVDNVTLSDVVFHMDGIDSGTALFTRGSSGLVLRDLEMIGYIPGEEDGVDPFDPDTRKNDPIEGYGTGRAIRIANGDDILIENLEIVDFKGGMRLEGLNNVEITGVEMIGLREGIGMFDITNMELAGNTFRDFNPWWNGDPDISDHPDMIQYWGKYSETGLHDITIRGNLFDQGEGWTQTIFGEMRNSPDGVTATGFHILDNVIINRHANTIRLDAVEDAVIENNLLLANQPEVEDAYPLINVQLTENIEVRGNVLASGSVLGMSDPEVELRGNMLLSREPGDETYWELLLDAWRAGDEFVMDGSSFIDQAREILGLEDDGGVEPPDGDPVTGMEIGTLSVEAGAETWRSVSFSEEILDARVVMGPVGSAAGADPMVVRVRNVTDSGFEYLIDEWDYLDGVHVAAEVSWMAASAGTHRLASGVQISAGRTTVVDDDETAVDLDPGQAAPVVFAQVTSANEADSVTTAIRAVGTDGFRVLMQEQEANDGKHVAESLDWISMDGADGLLEGLTRLNVGSDGRTVALPEEEFAFLASMQTLNGANARALAYTGSGESVHLWTQEETSQDAEVFHKVEQVAIYQPETGYHDLFAL